MGSIRPPHIDVGRVLDWLLNGTLHVTGLLRAQSLTLDTDLPISEGGTGASSASAARTNLGAAGLGANTFTGNQSITGALEASGTLRGNTATGTGTGAAVVGVASGAGHGVTGISATNTGVRGVSTAWRGVHSESGTGTSLVAEQTGASGATNPTGLIQRTAASTGTGPVLRVIDSTTGGGRLLDAQSNIGGTTATRATLAANGEYECHTAGSGIILRSPNGTRYRVTVDNSGALQVAAA